MSGNHEFPSEYFRTLFRVDSQCPPWPACFAIITACQTTGSRWPDSVNQLCDQRLYNWLLGCGLQPIRITGYSPDSGHAEPGWTVALELGLCCRLGHAFRQHAVYWVQADDLRVVCCAQPSQWRAVGSFRRRLRTIGRCADTATNPAPGWPTQFTVQ